MKKAMPFKGKQSKAEEAAEAKAVKSGRVTPAQYASREKAEGDSKSKSALMKTGKALASGKMPASKYASMATGKAKK